MEHVKSLLVKHNSVFGAGHYNKKNDIFPFTEVLSLTSFLKKKNNVRTKAGWPVLFRYFADVI